MNTADEVRRLLDHAQANRTTAATDMNEQSSRSHSVFCLRLTGTKLLNNGATQCLSGELYLVDLAGSERVDKSGVSGDRLREAQACPGTNNHCRARQLDRDDMHARVCACVHTCMRA